jgi:hypothetical protein
MQNTLAVKDLVEKCQSSVSQALPKAIQIRLRARQMISLICTEMYERDVPNTIIGLLLNLRMRIMPWKRDSKVDERRLQPNVTTAT